MIKHCACCGKSFEPRPQVPKQTYCSSADCQLARKMRWQQEKRRNDPLYRENQRDAQRAWLEKHPHYWRAYRAKRHVAEPTRKSNTSGAHNGTAKMDVSILSPGLYRLRRVAASSLVECGEGLFEITPVCPNCPCKKDACKR